MPPNPPPTKALYSTSGYNLADVGLATVFCSALELPPPEAMPGIHALMDYAMTVFAGLVRGLVQGCVSGDEPVALEVSLRDADKNPTFQVTVGVEIFLEVDRSKLNAAVKAAFKASELARRIQALVDLYASYAYGVDSRFQLMTVPVDRRSSASGGAIGGN